MKYAQGLAIVVATVTLGAEFAAAQPTTPADQAFREGRQLMAEGKIPKACAKFALSQKLEPALGTLLNLANCHELQGRTAAAWAEFKELHALATVKKRAMFADEAAKRAMALELRLTRLLLRASRVPGLVVRRNGKDVTAQLDRNTPIDPGTVTLTAEAPGHKPWRKQLSVTAEGKTTTVDIPPLERTERIGVPVATPGTTPAAPAPQQEGRSRRSVIGISVAGFGVASLTTGLVFGALAKGNWDDAKDECGGTAGCNPESDRLTDRALTQAGVATVLVPLGAVAIGVGAYLYFTDRGRNKATVVSPYVAPGGAGIALTRQF